MNYKDMPGYDENESRCVMRKIAEYPVVMLHMMGKSKRLTHIVVVVVPTKCAMTGLAHKRWAKNWVRK